MITYPQHSHLPDEYIADKIAEFLAEDMPWCDKTTEGTIPESETISAEIQTGGELVFAGENIIHHCFGEKCQTTLNHYDGDVLSNGDVIGTIGFKVHSTGTQPYNFKFAVYTESNSTTPTTLLCNTGNINPTGTGWLDFPVEFSGGSASTTHTKAGDGYVWIAHWGDESIGYYTEGVTSGGTK